MKICSRCKRMLPRESFNKCSITADGLQYYCKVCQTAYRKGQVNLKICSDCGEPKPLSEFYEARGTADGLFDKCKDCCTVNKSRHPDRKHYEKYFSAI